jgi:hypothetical protein
VKNEAEKTFKDRENHQNTSPTKFHCKKFSKHLLKLKRNVLREKFISSGANKIHWKR